MQEYNLERFMDETESLYESAPVNYLKILDIIYDLLHIRKEIMEAETLVSEYSAKAYLLLDEGEAGNVNPRLMLAGEQREKSLHNWYDVERKELSLEKSLFEIGVSAPNAYEGALNYEKAVGYVKQKILFALE